MATGQDLVDSARNLLGVWYEWWEEGEPIPLWWYEYGDTMPPRSWFDANGTMCLPGDTKVLARGVEKSYRRIYRGELITIKTAGGKELSGTPNHLILSKRGWVSLDSLHEGDHVVCYPGFDDLASTDCDGHDMPAPIQHIHGSLVDSGSLGRIPGTPLDFHGDGADGDIEVVHPHRQLEGGAEPPRLEHVSKLPFPSPHVPEVSLVGQRSTDLEALGGGGVRVAQPRSLPRTTAVAALLEPPVHHALGDPQTGSDRSLGFSHQVSFDKIINVEVQAFCGDVYNLQTVSGHYVANGIVNHNCSDLINAARNDNGLPSIGGTPTYYDWLYASSEWFDPSSAGVPGAVVVNPGVWRNGTGQGHIAMYTDGHTLIQATDGSGSMAGVNEGEQDYDSYQWADYWIYALMPDVDYSEHLGDAAPTPVDNAVVMPRWVSIDKDGWYKADGPDWAKGFHYYLDGGSLGPWKGPGEA